MKYFVYCRKSSEDKHRQILSIQSQLREVEKAFSGRDDIEIEAIFEEERSAMKPGRPVFAQMMSRVERGEAKGIISWAPDRLARNSIDGGRIIYLLDCGVIDDLKFLTYTFENNSQGKFMLQIMFGQSKYYSDALSENVRRGVRTKVENGWWPTIAPIGYRNDRETSTITADPARFSLVQRMLRMMLTGTYTAEQLWQVSRTWGLTTLQRRQLGGKPLALSSVYKILNSPFYAGIIRWNGKWYAGKHEPMITVAQHERIIEMLRRPGRPQPQKQHFAYAGLMRCGSCGLAVTAEHKTNRYGASYIYYHCTKRGRPRCSEPYIEVSQLETQIGEFLDGLQIPDAVCRWALRFLEREQLGADSSINDQRHSLEAAIGAAERRMLELADMRTRRLVEDQEYIAMREAGSRELLGLRDALASCEQKQNNWLEPAKALLMFGQQARGWFEVGTDEEKRLILNAIGSNFSLSGKILSIYARKPYAYTPKRRNFLTLRAGVENIRKMVGTSALDAALDCIRQVEELRAARLPAVPPAVAVRGR